MDLLARFRKPALPPQVLEVNVRGSVSIPAAVLSRLRRRPTALVKDHQDAKRGMWVTYLEEHIGILTNISTDDAATVMLVDPIDGTNKLEIQVPADQLRQAYYEELPAARSLPYEEAARFGYCHKP